MHKHSTRMLEPEAAGLTRLERQADDLAGLITRIIGRNADAGNAQFEPSNNNEPLLVQDDNPAGTIQESYGL
jgi:hypothetical protein